MRLHFLPVDLGFTIQRHCNAILALTFRENRTNKVTIVSKNHILALASSPIVYQLPFSSSPSGSKTGGSGEGERFFFFGKEIAGHFSRGPLFTGDEGRA